MPDPLVGADGVDLLVALGIVVTAFVLVRSAVLDFLERPKE